MEKTTFKTVLLNDMTFGVEILLSDQTAPYRVDSFATRAEAQYWIAERIRHNDLAAPSVGNQ
jgi:hypothetical protein